MIIIIFVQLANRDASARISDLQSQLAASESELASVRSTSKIRLVQAEQVCMKNCKFTGLMGELHQCFWSNRASYLSFPRVFVLIFILLTSSRSFHHRNIIIIIRC
jgi:hypothetical protein